MTRTDAWVLHAGPIGVPQRRGELVRETLRLPTQSDDEALVEPLFGAWEANLTHAIMRSPVDVCRQRGEDRVLLGNAGVVRVLRPAAAVPGPGEGRLCLLVPLARRDHRGYPELIHGYDAPRTYGLLATRTLVPAALLLPLPERGGPSALQWASYARYFTAWDNWKVAYACWRSQMDDEDPADHLVFGWGGGVALAELALARRHGFRTAMTASTDERLALIARHGITAIDRRDIPDLTTGHGDRRARVSARRFLNRISTLSDGRGCAIILDNIGGPAYATTLRALARQGVVSTCGWKAGMRLLQVGRAAQCQGRHLHVHTHGWRFDDSTVIRDFLAETGLLTEQYPAVPYSFDNIPQLAADYADNRVTTYFPLYRVNPE